MAKELLKKFDKTRVKAEKMYRKKLIVITNCIKKIHIKKGSCFWMPLKKIIIKDSDIARKIIPNISDNPATA